MDVTIAIPADLAIEYANACARGADRAGAAFERSNQLSDETECVRLDALATIIRNAIAHPTRPYSHYTDQYLHGQIRMCEVSIMCLAMVNGDSTADREYLDGLRAEAAIRAEGTREVTHA
jgi:hypothetical protein